MELLLKIEKGGSARHDISVGVGMVGWEVALELLFQERFAGNYRIENAAEAVLLLTYLRNNLVQGRTITETNHGARRIDQHLRSQIASKGFLIAGD